MNPFELVRSEDQRATPALARQFAEMPASPVERELAESRVGYLDAVVKHGIAVAFNWATAELDGVVYRANGLHSSTALARMNGSMPDNLTVHIDHYKVDDQAGLVALFRQFDSRQSARKPRDVAGAYQGCVEALKDVPRGYAKIAVEGVAWYRGKVEDEEVPKGDDQYALMNEEELHSFIIWVGTGILDVKTPELKRVPVVAAMHATFEVADEPAREFWADVAKGGKAFDDKAPATQLDVWLKSLLKKGTRPDFVKGENVYQACIYCWNAFRAGKTFDKMKWDTKKGFLEID